MEVEVVCAPSGTAGLELTLSFSCLGSVTRVDLGVYHATLIEFLPGCNVVTMLAAGSVAMHATAFILLTVSLLFTPLGRLGTFLYPCGGRRGFGG